MSEINHQIYIKRCFELANKALGKTSPNPLVGCVIVKNGTVISEGHHSGPGFAHAEAAAMADIDPSMLAGATLYSNLEPCCHTNKRTPPCAQAIIKAGIAKVVCSNLDPNPEVAGKGVELLSQAGIEVITGVLEKEGSRLNEVFFYHIIQKRPFYHVKWAQGLDGRMACLNGESKWISNNLSREKVHQFRMSYDAVMITASTLLADDAELTARCKQGKILKATLPIVIGTLSKKRLDKLHSSRLFQIHNKILWFGNCSVDKGSIPPKIKFVENRKYCFSTISNELYKRGVHSCLIEGGPSLISSAISSGSISKLSVFIAPKLMGEGLGPFRTSKPLEKVIDGLEFKNVEVEKLGDDLHWMVHIDHVYRTR